MADRTAVVAVSEVRLVAVSTPVVLVIDPLLSVTTPTVSEKPPKSRTPPLTVIALELPSWSSAPRARVPSVTVVSPAKEKVPPLESVRIPAPALVRRPAPVTIPARE